MRTLPAALLAAAAVCFAFAYRGLETPAGRHAYDEMAGIIPMAVGLAGGVLLVAGVALWLWRHFRKRDR